MLFQSIFGIASIIGGAIASVTGFGIGSILTPTLAAQFGTKLAVAAVSIPHAVGTVTRFALIWRSVDKRVLIRFGIASALGGLAGALLHTVFTSIVLNYILGVLLLFAGVLNMFGLASTMRFGRSVAWFAGLTSGVFGGLVGNQGGIRSAALLGFELDKQAFVATGTAIGIVVDLARMPVYIAAESHQLVDLWPYLLIGTVGVLIGTFLGKTILTKIPENIFRRVVGTIVFLLGIALIVYPNP